MYYLNYHFDKARGLWRVPLRYHTTLQSGRNQNNHNLIAQLSKLYLRLHPSYPIALLSL